MDALRAFEGVDFQWTQNVDSVWQDPRYDIRSLHQKQRQEVLAKIRTMAVSADQGSPLGWVLIGPGGVGKTHLLSAIRRDVLGVPAGFILVPMIDVRDFWETVLLGFIDALQRPAGETEVTQGQLVVQHIAAQVRGDDGVALTQELAELTPPRLARVMDDLVQRIGRPHRAQTLKHADTLRALVLLNSNHLDLSNLGYAWLQGYGVDESVMEVFGFNIREKRASAVVEGLSWLISLRCPMVVAFDQLDPIVSEHYVLAAASDVPEERTVRQIAAQNIIDSVGRGLMELRDLTRRTLSVVSCLEESWVKLKDTTLKTATQRFEEQRYLENLSDTAMAMDLVGARLEAGYGRVGFTPPHPLWPFARSAFASVSGKSPRELLITCERHRRACVDADRVSELDTFASAEPPRPLSTSAPQREWDALDKELGRLRASAKLPHEAPGEDADAVLGKLLRAGCELVVAEQAHDPAIGLTIEPDSGGKRGYPALHARVRQIFAARNDRERHLCLRVMWKDNAIAFQTRLNAALTASGIDRQIEFRKLIMVRNAPVPGGPVTSALLKARAAGAEMIAANDDDLRALVALVALREVQGDKGELFEHWLRERRPASRLALMKPVADWLAPSPEARTAQASARATPTTRANVAAAPVIEATAPVAAPPSLTVTATASAAITVVSPPASGAPVQPAAPRPVIPVGHQVVGDRLTAPQVILAEDLKRHVVVLAGAGSGKTVLLRRLVEEAALIGVPSIVVDGANDLTRLGEPWPERPAAFTEEDAGKAARYHADTDVIVWTPGRANGNPLHLGLLPDFVAVAQDADDLTQAVAMTVDTLAGMAGKRIDSTGRGILDATLRYFAKQGGGDLGTFLDVLADLPPEANLGISTAAKVATTLSDALRAAVQTNPLLHQEGEPLDPGILFGLGSARPRVSVLSLVGLPGGDAPLQFVNQLAMTLFTWVKKNPCPADRPLRGLLVLDEAKDFVPSQGSTPCKESLIRLAAQGRKYGLGVVFATQAPKSIDHNVIANASTQLFGKASSPAAIDTVEEQLRARGGTKSDVARLPSGRFYLAGMGMAAPVKIAVPLCLSHHPAAPPDEADVIRRARASRARLG